MPKLIFYLTLTFAFFLKSGTGYSAFQSFRVEQILNIAIFCCPFTQKLLSTAIFCIVIVPGILFNIAIWLGDIHINLKKQLLNIAILHCRLFPKIYFCKPYNWNIERLHKDCPQPARLLWEEHLYNLAKPSLKKS